jgi:predicted AAA+ superfamily ATPase
LDNEILKKEELSTYFDTVIIKDIVKRYKLSNIDDVKKLAYYFLSNNAKLFSINSLKKLNLLAYDTIKKYLSYFEECYLFFEMLKFDYSIKKQLINQKKIYSIDLGFVNLLGFNFSENIGRNLENLVFIELKRLGKQVYYHKSTKECDFVVYD